MKLPPAFAFALVLVFLVLAAQFESWLNPLIIMLTVPIILASPDDPPKSIDIRMPAQTRELRVPLSLSDLPLP